MNRLQKTIFPLALALAAAAAAQARPAATPATTAANSLAKGGVEIRRTTDGIPHLRAANWRDLGTGVGYVQAQDALCTLAEAFVTYEGRRAWFFGAEARPALDSTFGKPKNVDLDFFFRSFADAEVLAQYRAQQPAGLNALIDGYAAGYNRYLADARSGRVPAAGRICLKQDWVRAITVEDIYRRMYAAQVAAGYARFASALTGARPAATAAASAQVEAGAPDLHDKLAQTIGEQPGIGSNVLALGRAATGEEGAVLFGNPHWYWGGPDRFYQMHLTIPGRLNVAGVTFLGVPVVMIGFNDHVAWSHTVSTARRFGLFELTLDPVDPTRYQVDGQTEAMTAREVSVDVRGADGKPGRVTRTLYRSRFGPMIDLGSQHAAFGWGAARALAMRDVNADNFRIFRNFFYWNQAASLDDFIAIQRREAAVPWVNTAAIGRGDGRVWFGDIGAVPNAPDDLRAACATQLGQGFARIDPLTPFLDASRSACDWRIDPAAVQRGAMPAAAQPGLLRQDYVANMNDSYWLSNVHQPLEGFPALFGGERKALELRGRLGHRIALGLLDKPAPSAAVLGERLKGEVLHPRVHSAELFKEEFLAQACSASSVQVEAEGGARTVDTGAACRILHSWSGRAEAGDRGAVLWEAVWARLRKIAPEKLYQVAFSSAEPLATPAKPRLEGAGAAQALGAAVLALEAQGVALDAPLGSRRYVATGGQRVPLYGGCHGSGYFTVACGYDDQGRMGPDSHANSYLQLVRFGPRGVEAYTLLAHGQDEAAVDNGQGSAPVLRYARKDWLRFPFREADIQRDPGLTRSVLRPLAAGGG